MGGREKNGLGWKDMGGWGKGLFSFSEEGEKLFTYLETNNTNHEWRHISVLEKGFLSASLDDAIAVIKLHMRCFFVWAEMHFWRSPPVTRKASVTLHMYLPTILYMPEVG